MFTLEEVIDLAIKIEENGEKVYRTASQEVPPGPVQELLLKLAQDEVQHIEWFRELRREIKTSVDNPKLYEMGRSILNAIVGDQSFSLKEAGLAQMDDIRRVLEAALEFERDTMLFYDMLSTAVNEDVLPYMSRIMEEEERHVKELEAALSAQAVGPAK